MTKNFKTCLKPTSDNRASKKSLRVKLKFRRNFISSFHKTYPTLYTGIIKIKGIRRSYLANFKAYSISQDYFHTLIFFFGKIGS